MSDLTFTDLVAPVRDLAAGADPLTSWRWLAGPDARPLLVTALGDVFVEQPDGAVAFLDTYEGHVRVVAGSRDEWKAALRRSENLEAWFGPGLVSELRQRDLVLQEGQCYSPNHPLILGGTMDPNNFEVTSWRVHLGVMGQIYEQTSMLPPGTRITGFTTE